MEIRVFADVDSVAQAAAVLIASQARIAVADRDRFVLAVSGGHTPWLMLRALAGRDIAWDAVDVLQVDERVVSNGHPDRNLMHISETLRHAPLPPEQIHAMPVDSPDLEAAAIQYELTLRQIAGSPAELDLVHLGLGADGHTASLVPGDRVLEITDRDVALTGVYQGHRRMTLTYPILNRARRVLWIVTGKEKAEALHRLWAGDTSIPAGRVRREWALVLADCSAASELDQGSITEETWTKEGTCA